VLLFSPVLRINPSPETQDRWRQYRSFWPSLPRTKFRPENKQRRRSNCSNQVVECKILPGRFACRKWRTIAMAVLVKRKELILNQSNNEWN
jgi:hypothetical protein